MSNLQTSIYGIAPVVNATEVNAAYVPLPKFYTFKSREERERILYKNFVQVGQDVKEMIKDVLNQRNAK